MTPNDCPGSFLSDGLCNTAVSTQLIASFFISGASVDVVRMQTGMLLRSSSVLISCSTSRPSFLGRFRSSMTRSGLRASV